VVVVVLVVAAVVVAAVEFVVDVDVDVDVAVVVVGTAVESTGAAGCCVPPSHPVNTAKPSAAAINAPAADGVRRFPRTTNTPLVTRISFARDNSASTSGHHRRVDPDIGSFGDAVTPCTQASLVRRSGVRRRGDVGRLRRARPCACAPVRRTTE
jgi:hypothetical protein